jgi:hypothetical protein
MVKLVVGERISPPLGAVTVTVAAAQLAARPLKLSRYRDGTSNRNAAIATGRMTNLLSLIVDFSVIGVALHIYSFLTSRFSAR